MAFKFVVLLAAVACANAGLIGAPVAYSAAPAVSHVSYASPVVSYGQPQVPTLTSQHQNILRSPGNLAQVSTYSKTIDTPYSSVSKHDVRVSNPGYATYAAAAPALVTKTYAAAPVAYAAPAIQHYAAPVQHYAAPAVQHYAAPAVQHYAAPQTYAAAPAVAHGLLGVAYSAAPAVSHMSYSAPAIGLSYGW